MAATSTNLGNAPRGDTTHYHYIPPQWPYCLHLFKLGHELNYRPLISIIIPTYNTPEVYLKAAIESVRNQLYENWELCIADDASTVPHVVRILKEYAAKDDRIRFVACEKNENISAATNSALKIANGEFVLFLDHDDELTIDALAEVIICLNKNPQIDILYSDHDKQEGATISYVEPHFKPDWSPEYFRGVMYVAHFLCVRHTLFNSIGGFDSQFDGIQDYEGMLRLSEVTTSECIMHIPKVLYHWRKIPGSIATREDAKGENITLLQTKAVNLHLQRQNLPAEAKPHPQYSHRVRIDPKPLLNYPKVSIIIPSKDAPEYLERCLKSITQVSTYPNYEIIIGDNDSTDPRALALMQQFNCKRILCPGVFNFSRVNNECVKTASGDFIILLNNDTEVITPDWIEQLYYYAAQKDIGAVGSLLLFPDNSIQHAGVILGPRGTADHVMRGFPADSDGYAGTLTTAREVIAVTAACLMVKKDLYELAGGLNEHYFTQYQDVDFCLTLNQQLHRRNIFTPHAKLTHYESVSRKTYYDLVDRYLFLDRWNNLLKSGDPYYNPNFDCNYDDYRLHPELLTNCDPFPTLRSAA